LSSKEVLNDTKVHNLSQILDLVKNRPKGKPLITVSNHDSCIDDPLLFGAILPTKYFFDFDKKYFRWSLGAKEVCFSKPSHSLIMRAGQVLLE
jgi:monolysocardiolipin acyltransferase